MTIEYTCYQNFIAKMIFVPSELFSMNASHHSFHCPNEKLPNNNNSNKKTFENVRKETKLIAYIVCNCLTVCNLFPLDDSNLATFIAFLFLLLRFHTDWSREHAYVTSAPHRISVIHRNFTFIGSYRTQQHSLQSTQNIVVAPITIETRFRCVYAIRMQRNSGLLFC